MVGIPTTSLQRLQEFVGLILLCLVEFAVPKCVNPIFLGEIEYGIGLTPSARKRKALERWFAEGMQRLRVVDLDAGTASVWAGMLVRMKAKGRAMPVRDSLIAASALQHHLTVVTPNTTDFQHAGVPLIDPFE